MGIARILKSCIRRLNAEGYRHEVALAYKAVLHRDPDPNGMAGYLGNVLAGRQSVSDVTQELLGSAERLGLEQHSIPTNGQDLVRQLYQTILGRDPDAAGLAAHVQRIDGGHTTIADLVREFLGSAEFANRISLLPAVANRLAQLLIVGMTGRNPGETAVRDYGHAMNQGYPLEAFIDELRRSPEFGNRGHGSVSGVVDRDIALLAAELIAVQLGDEGSTLSLPPLQPEGMAVVPARTMASLLHTLSMLARSRHAVAGSTT